MCAINFGFGEILMEVEWLTFKNKMAFKTKIKFHHHSYTLVVSLSGHKTPDYNSQ